MGIFSVCEAMIGDAAGCMDQKITLPLNATHEKRGVLAPESGNPPRKLVRFAPILHLMHRVSPGGSEHLTPGLSRE
jgi:hypothetical protein